MTAPTTPTGLTDAECDALIRAAWLDRFGVVADTARWGIANSDRAVTRAAYAAGQMSVSESYAQRQAHPQGQGEPDEVLADALAVIGEKIQHADGFDPHLLHIMVPVDVLRVLYAAQGQGEPTQFARIMAAVQPVAHHGTCSSEDEIVGLARVYSAIRSEIRAAPAAQGQVSASVPRKVYPPGEHCLACGQSLAHDDNAPAPPHAGQEPDALVQRLREPIPWVGGRLEWNSIPTIHARLIDEQREQAADRIEADAARIKELEATILDLSNGVADFCRAVGLGDKAKEIADCIADAKKRQASAKADERSDGQGAG